MDIAECRAIFLKTEDNKSPENEIITVHVEIFAFFRELSSSRKLPPERK